MKATFDCLAPVAKLYRGREGVNMNKLSQQGNIF